MLASLNSRMLVLCALVAGAIMLTPSGAMAVLCNCPQSLQSGCVTGCSLGCEQDDKEWDNCAACCETVYQNCITAPAGQEPKGTEYAKCVTDNC